MKPGSLCSLARISVGFPCELFPYPTLNNHIELEANPSIHCLPEAPPATPPPAEHLTKNQTKNIKDRLLRKSRRELNGSSPKECSQKYRESTRQHPVFIDSNTATDLPHSKPAWIGVRELEGDWNVYSLTELQEVYGMQLVEWDGK